MIGVIGVIGVTCAHVVEGFRQMQSDLGKALFQIGNVERDPLDQLIAEHKDFDLATISLSANQLKLLLAEGEIGSRVIKPTQWPPQSVMENNKLCSVVSRGLCANARTLTNSHLAHLALREYQLRRLTEALGRNSELSSTETSIIRIEPKFRAMADATPYPGVVSPRGPKARLAP